MSYQAAWAQSDANGQVVAGQHYVLAGDVGEIAAAINRRRRLVYLAEQDFSAATAALSPIRQALFNSSFPPPLTNFRYSLETTLLHPTAGGMGGQPPSPASMQWLWPVADADENKVLVNGFSGVQAGQVRLFTKLNGQNDWTDPALVGGGTYVRAVHVNELRRAVEFLRRGRWTLPIYPAGGLFSLLPDNPWLTGTLSNNGTSQLRSAGFAVIVTGEPTPRGLTGLTARNSSAIRLTANTACQVQVYRCKRAIDFVNDPPTWNRYAPLAGGSWATPGGLGSADAELLGSATCPANTPTALSGSSIAAAITTLLAGQPQNFLFRRADVATGNVQFSAELVVEFDLDSPPNQSAFCGQSP